MGLQKNFVYMLVSIFVIDLGKDKYFSFPQNISPPIVLSSSIVYEYLSVV